MDEMIGYILNSVKDQDKEIRRLTRKVQAQKSQMIFQWLVIAALAGKVGKKLKDLHEGLNKETEEKI